MADIERRFSDWVIHHRWWFLIISPIIVFMLATGLLGLKFKTDYRVFFSPDNPQLQAFQELEKTYTQDDNVIFMLIPPEGDVFTRETLAAVEEVTEMAWQLPYSLRVDSLSNFQHTEARGDDLLVANLFRNGGELSDAQIQRVRSIALAEPLLAEKIVPLDARITIVNVTVQLPHLDDTKEVPEVTAAARRMADEIRARHPHLDVRLNGVVLMNNAFSEASLNDMKFLVPLSFLVMVVALVLLLRGATGTLATLAVVGLSILAGMGAGGYIGLPITPPSAAAPVVILTVAIADSVHVLVIYYQQLAAGADREAAMKESLRINLQPIVLTSLTTVIGFLSINLSEVPPFRDLANFVAIGITAAFVLSVTFLPALMTVLPARARRMETDSRVMDALAGFVVNHRVRLLWFMSGFVLLLLAFIPRNELNDVYIRYFDESIQFRVDADLLDEHMGGLYWIDYSLDSKESNGIHEPAFLEKLENFANWLRQQPEVTHVNSVTDIFKRLNKNLHGDDPDWHRLPDERTMAAQFLLLYEMSLPYGLDLNNQIDVDKSSTRIRVSTHVLSTKQVLGLDERARMWLEDNAPALATEGVGSAMMFAYIGARNIRAMLKATLIALVLISIILVITLRSLKIGAMSMVPNLVPMGMAFGIWGITSGEIGLSLSVVSAMTIGIVVDDTIHFLSKYLRARHEQGTTPEDATRYAFSTVGMALVITSVTLIAGFLVLAWSDFHLNNSMGMMTSLILFLALVADFLFLPPLLMKLEKAKR